MREEIIKNIRKSKPFIYQIGEKFFYLGAGVCCECDESEKKVFLKYLKELKYLEKIKCNLRKSDVKKIIGYYDEIMKSPKTVYDPSNESFARRKIENLLGNVSELEIKQVAKQHKEMITVLDYKDGAFYRHNNCLNEGNKNE